MPRSYILVAAFLAVLLIGGCEKKDQGAAVQPAVTDAPAIGPAEVPTKHGSTLTLGPGDKDLPVDLSQYLVFGEIGLPPGTTVAQGARTVRSAMRANFRD